MTLDFTDEHGARHFEFVFVGFVLGGSMLDKKGLALLRREVALFEKLEAISEPRPCGKKLANGEADRQLLNGDHAKQVELAPQELELLTAYLAQVPWQAGSPAKYALETIDWLTRVQRRHEVQ